jgi:hypothetical protein
VGVYVKEVTKLMINEFKLRELGFDFMGYHLQKGDIYTFHHLIIPNRNGGPYARWNGAILFSTPHSYLHVVENKDYDVFSYVTSEMIDMNIKGYLDPQNIRAIDDALRSFEREYSGARTRKGKVLIKEEYTRRVKL